MDLEGAQAFGGEGDAPLGGQGLGVQDGQALASGALEGAVDGGGAAVEAEEFALAESSAQGEFVQGAWSRLLLAAWSNRGAPHREGFEAPRS